MKGLVGGFGDFFVFFNFVARRKRFIWGRFYSDIIIRNGKDFF